MAKTKKFGGRPREREPKPGERLHLGLRVSPSLKRKLERAAAQSTRSLSQEVEFRLERSFEMQTAVDFLKAEILPRLLAHPPGLLAAAKGEVPTHAEAEMTLAELVVEGRHLSGNPNLGPASALAYLAARGNAQAKAILTETRERRRLEEIMLSRGREERAPLKKA